MLIFEMQRLNSGSKDKCVPEPEAQLAISPQLKGLNIAAEAVEALMRNV